MTDSFAKRVVDGSDRMAERKGPKWSICFLGGLLGHLERTGITFQVVTELVADRVHVNVFEEAETPDLLAGFDRIILRFDDDMDAVNVLTVLDYELVDDLGALQVEPNLGGVAADELWKRCLGGMVGFMSIRSWA